MNTRCAAGFASRSAAVRGKLHTFSAPGISSVRVDGWMRRREAQINLFARLTLLSFLSRGIFLHYSRRVYLTRKCESRLI